MERLLALLPVVAASLARGQAMLTQIPSLPGSLANDLTAMNGQASVVLGKCLVGSDWRAFRWSLETGTQALEILPWATDCTAYDLRGDGGVIVGACEAAGRSSAVRWETDLSVQELALPAGWSQSAARAVTGDARVIFGFARTDRGVTAPCRWTEGAQAEPLPGFPESDRAGVYAASANGRYATGWYTVSGEERVFLWSENDGFRDVGLLPGSWWGAGLDVSDDGSTIVGHSNIRAFRWRADTGWLDLNWPPSREWSWCNAVTATGRVAVGDTWSMDWGDASFYWREDLGLVFLDPGALGMPFDLGQFDRAADISPDGTAFVGIGGGRMWRVSGLSRVDSLCMPDFTNDGVLDVADVQEFLTRYADGSVEADFVLDGTLDFFDVQEFLNRFAAGCD